MAQVIQLKRGTASKWMSVNPILAEGELGVEKDTGKFKLGDGVSHWNNLIYSSGTKGDTGDVGLQGPKGDQGDPGDPGGIGDKGPTGDKGPNGDKGADGNKGLTGDDGLPGDQGIKGPDGDKGLTGDKGLSGDNGLTGDQGPIGSQGPVGDKGATGDKGPTGDKGATGDPGTGLGTMINVLALTSSPVDSQTIYFGMLPKAPTTTANISKIYIRKTCTLKIVEIYCYSGTAGTAESWSLYVRKNNTTDTLIATLGVATSERVFSNTGLSVSLVAGDYLEIKAVNPLWATNPLTCIFGGYLYFE